MQQLELFPPSAYQPKPPPIWMICDSCGEPFAIHARIRASMPHCVVAWRCECAHRVTYVTLA